MPRHARPLIDIIVGARPNFLRESTGRPHTVSIGTNELLGADPKALKPPLDRLFAGSWKGRTPDKWDGRAAERIANALKALPAA